MKNSHRAPVLAWVSLLLAGCHPEGSVGRIIDSGATNPDDAAFTDGTDTAISTDVPVPIDASDVAQDRGDATVVTDVAGDLGPTDDLVDVLGESLDVTCAPGQVECSPGACADLMNDARNCGACMVFCAAGQSCRAGACTTMPGCSTDLDCAAGQVCVAGNCQIAPDAGACTPSPEVCNGLDDDCNGLIDDGIVCGDV